MSRGCADVSDFACYQAMIIAAIEREYPSRLIPLLFIYLTFLLTDQPGFVRRTCQGNS